MIDETDSALTPLNPAHVPVSRIATGFGLLLFLIGAGVLEVAQLLPPGSFIVPALLLYAYIAFVIPARRYRYWGYDMGTDRLRIVRGYMYHRDVVVPFGRIQHIDVDQGPIQRRYDLATLTVHTAGNQNSTVSLPGLLHADALEMRETIRAAIRQDAL